MGVLELLNSIVERGGDLLPLEGVHGHETKHLPTSFPFVVCLTRWYVQARYTMSVIPGSTAKFLRSAITMTS